MKSPLLFLIFMVYALLASPVISQSTINAMTTSQSAASITPEQRITALQEANIALKRILPSFTCDETITSSEQGEHTAQKQTHATAQFRLLKTELPEGVALKEDRILLTINGIPAKNNKLSAPVKVDGQFGYVLGFFNKENMACYNISILSESPHMIEYALRKKSDLSSRQCSWVTPDTSARVSFDPSTLFMQHFEVTIPNAQNIKHSTLVQSMDFRALALGGDTYTLPETSTMTLTDRTAPRSASWQSQYSGCILFKSSMTIRPGVIETTP